MMKRLKQINESKTIIVRALLELLQEKEFKNITVSDIAKKAEIGRNTFYSHFQKKEDIVIYLMEKHFLARQEKIASMDNVSIEELLILRFRMIKESPFIQILVKDEDVKFLVINFRNEKLSTLEFSKDEAIYKNEFFQGGLSYVTMKWIEMGMKESPEEMAFKIISLIKIV